MRRAIISLMLITMMALSVTIAVAENYSSNGPYTEANGWSTSENWNGNSPAGTDLSTASHAVTTGASGAFDFKATFTPADIHNYVEVGLTDTTGKSMMVGYTYMVDSEDGTYKGFWLINGLDFDNTGHYADMGATDMEISSSDGKTWTVSILGTSMPVSMDGVPASIYLQAKKDADATAAPSIGGITFTSDGSAATPTPTATPDPTATPTPDATITPTPEPTAIPAPVSGPSADDLKKVQDFYDNQYQQIHSPWDIVTYDGKGGYTITPTTNYSKGTTAAAPATYAISGSVTGAADGLPISGASVVIDSSMQKTNGNGEYKFSGMKAGSYDVAVSADGFAAKTQTINVAGNTALNFALDKASTGSAPIASAANESVNKTPANNTAIAAGTNATAKPAATQTKSPGFEAILALLSVVAVAGALMYASRKK